MLNIFNAVPPDMNALMEGNGADTVLLREILPRIISHLLYIIQMNGNDNPNGTPNGSAA